MKEYKNKRGQYHRLDGPEIERADGSKYWFQNGQRHRVDGPAIEYPDGSKEWRQNDQLHRVDGPAVEHTDGHREWFVYGKDITREVESWIKQQRFSLPLNESELTLFVLQFV